MLGQEGKRQVGEKIWEIRFVVQFLMENVFPELQEINSSHFSKLAYTNAKLIKVML
jgi:hypothetical protein